jgi:hypothetical protein
MSDEYYPVEAETESVSRIWYLVPFFFGIIGGLIAYVGTRDRDKDIAGKLLIFGILWNLVWLVISWWVYVNAL